VAPAGDARDPGARPARRPADTIQPFPTFSEIYVEALKALRGEIAAKSNAVAGV
jgi:hypothetical protein